MEYSNSKGTTPAEAQRTDTEAHTGATNVKIELKIHEGQLVSYKENSIWLPLKEQYSVSDGVLVLSDDPYITHLTEYGIRQISLERFSSKQTSKENNADLTFQLVTKICTAEQYIFFSKAPSDAWSKKLPITRQLWLGTGVQTP